MNNNYHQPRHRAKEPSLSWPTTVAVALIAAMIVLALWMLHSAASASHNAASTGANWDASYASCVFDDRGHGGGGMW